MDIAASALPPEFLVIGFLALSVRYPYSGLFIFIVDLYHSGNEIKH